jgi:hypothetical protein
LRNTIGSSGPAAELGRVRLVVLATATTFEDARATDIVERDLLPVGSGSPKNVP